MGARIGPTRWKSVEELFHKALEHDPTSRDGFVDEACGSDARLRAAVRTLLSAHEREGPLGAADVVEFADAIGDAYGIESEIGAGGMATVYVAHDAKHDRSVAVKVLRSDVATIIGPERFLQEIRLTANLQHPHILPLYDSGEAQGYLYYVTPFATGGSLRDLIAREGRLPLDLVLSLIGQVAGALEYAHRHGVVHRDVKPENILLLEGQPLVADFGIARALGPEQAGRLTQVGIRMGTPQYMSPEQAVGDLDVDGRTDVYALGCVLYECLAGSPPFRGDTTRSVVAQHLNADVPAVAPQRDDVPEFVDHVIATALAKSPEDRFAVPGDFAAALSRQKSGGQPEPVGHSASGSTRTDPGHRVLERRRTPHLARQQSIRFCTARDGASIAYATVGEGPPLVKTANWLSHLEFDWRSPMWRHWWEGLSRYHRLIRYDERGTGLSGWQVPEVSFDAWLEDLEAVVDAAGLDRFDLLGVSQGGPIAIAYSVRHPERVRRMLIHGAYARGRLKRDPTPEKLAEHVLFKDLVKVGWGRQNPAFRHVFSSFFYPDAAEEHLSWLDEQQRISVSPENAIKVIEACDHIDVRDQATLVSVPTLVLHCRGDERIPADEGRLLASLIPGAQFAMLESRNHIPLEDEPAWRQFLDEVYRFLGVGPTG